MASKTKELRCFCHDGSVFPVQARQESKGKWHLYVADIIGMGSADYHRKLVDEALDEVLPLNSFSNTSYICMRKGKKWGLIQLRSSETEYFAWEQLDDFKYDSLAEMLQSRNIKLSDYPFPR